MGDIFILEEVSGGVIISYGDKSRLLSQDELDEINEYFDKKWEEEQKFLSSYWENK